MEERSDKQHPIYTPLYRSSTIKTVLILYLKIVNLFKARWANLNETRGDASMNENLILVIVIVIVGFVIFKLLSYFKNNFILEYSGNFNLKIGRMDKIKKD